MLSKVIIGTANFVKPYGVFAAGKSVPLAEVHAIVDYALTAGITTYDTALAYGDLDSVMPPTCCAHLVTKFSVLEDEAILLDSLKKSRLPCQTVLVHDPQHLSCVSKTKLSRLFQRLRSECGVLQIGVSVYDLKDVAAFREVCIPDVIQLPLNPLNQMFQCAEFLHWVAEHRIVIQARSLFLQGLLLAEALPPKFAALQPVWQAFTRAFPQRLQTLLAWAKAQAWVQHWVLGVSSLQELKALVEGAKNNVLAQPVSFKPEMHPLADPRNWSAL